MLRPFIAAGDFSGRSVREFAKAAGVAPGIVAGRLQHDQVVAPGQLNELKRPIDLLTDG